MNRYTLTFVLIVTLVWGMQGSARCGDWHIEPGATWAVDGHIIEPIDVSGLTSIGEDNGILVSDETRSAQRFHLNRDSKMIVAGDSVPLLPGTGKEADLEGITASSDGKWFYATGSHGVSRKTGGLKPDRSHVFRIAADSVNGKVTISTLLPVIESDAMLKGAIGKSSEEGGVDIEGVAERDGVLFFGVRSPSMSGHAFVIETNAEALFADATKVAHRTHELALGAGRGIRDLVRVSDGFLLIAGSAKNDNPGDAFVLHHWQGLGGKLTKIGEVPKAAGKAEGLLVLDESADKLTVLVVFDGVLNDGPMELTLLKPHQ